MLLCDHRLPSAPATLPPVEGYRLDASVGLPADLKFLRQRPQTAMVASEWKLPMSRSHGSLVAAARARPHVAARAMLDLVASAPCLSPVKVHRTSPPPPEQLGAPPSGVETRPLGQKAPWSRGLTSASTWPSSDGAKLSADELLWAEASLELQLQRETITSPAISASSTRLAATLPPPRASSTGQDQRRAAPAAWRLEGRATTTLSGSRQLGTAPQVRGPTERLLVSRRWTGLAGWREVSQPRSSWLERGPTGMKGAYHSSPEAREVLSERLWGLKAAGEGHVGS